MVRKSQSIINVPVNIGFHIYRIGYYITPQFRKLFAADSKALGICWISLLSIIQDEFRNSLLIPVMDGLNQDCVDKFSGMMQGFNIASAAGFKDSISISNTDNIIGEVFFADSKYSILTQIVDIISYLRCVNDQFCENNVFSPFKTDLHACNKNLVSQIRFEHIVELNEKVVNRLDGSEYPVGTGPYSGSRDGLPITEFTSILSN